MQSVFFYTYNGMVASTDLGWTQNAFGTLTGIFDQVGLKTNVQKKMGMVCHPCHTVEVQAEESYTWQMIGVRRDYKERQREWVS